MAIPAVSGTPILAADMNSKASQSALDAEAAARVAADDALDTALDLKAPLASPTFTGTVTLPATVVVPDGTLAIADTSGLQSALDGKVASSLVDAAGDLLVGTADNTVGRLAKGSALDVLRVNAGATALEWAAPSGGSLPSAAPNALTGSPTLHLWFKADAITGLSNGASVASWSDSSGNSRTLSQATGSKQPTYRSAVQLLGGQPAVQFDGTDDTLTNLASGIAAGGAWTMVAVATETQNVDGRYIFDGRTSGNLDLFRSSGSPTMRGGNVTGTGAVNYTVRQTGIWVGSYDGAYETIFLNGVALMERAQAANNATPTSLYLASNADSAGSYWAGHIAEFILYGAALSAAQRRQLTNHLAAKYQIPIGLSA